MALFGPPGAGDRIARRLLAPLLVMLLLLVTVFWILFTPLRISGDSMMPGLAGEDRVLVTRGYNEPSRGDVVHIDARLIGGARGQQVVKRIVGLPGDTVGIDRGAAVVNGTFEDASGPILLDDGDVSIAEIVVPEGHVYVLGDNRPVSLDSRFYGAVPLPAIHGRLVFRFTPVTRLGPVD